eukprot:209776-Rhodomonas_salina.3
MHDYVQDFADPRDLFVCSDFRGTLHGTLIRSMSVTAPQVPPYLSADAYQGRPLCTDLRRGAIGLGDLQLDVREEEGCIG